MISIIITACDDARPLARLLSALVPAVADGLVREAAVLGASGASHDVADDAGASLYPADAFIAAFDRMRGPWVARLPVKALFVPNWTEILTAFVTRDSAEGALLVARRGPIRLRATPEGWLVRKPLGELAAATREQDFERLARRSRRRLAILDRG